jgi:two-component system CheB/CheR fusion protein
VLATRIVGIGASAGGLEALEQFFRQVPSKSGLAYIVVQHLDPTKKAMLAELLQRETAMLVHEAKAEMRVEPNRVYVIPPDKELRVVNNVLNLERPGEPRGMRLPIDVLFSSLASAQSERAIGVVLSGMGSDGTLGLQAIKAVGGLTVVQQPDTAKFDSMPKSAIAAGCADMVAPAAELPSCIFSYISRVPDSGSTVEEDDESAAAEPLHTIFKLLQQRTGHDLSQYKQSTLHRRIARRMAIHAIATLAGYTDFLRQNPQEIDLLFNELLIGVTSFFRDADVWEHLAQVALPELLAQRTAERKLRAWVIGCSTGEEAYSLGIVFTEAAQRLAQAHDFELQIFASDLSSHAIATARRGEYPASITSDVSTGRLERFFSAHGTHYQINTSIRDMVLFAQHDVTLDPPFTRLDLITCRNLLIYFDAALQRRLIPLFHYCLRPDGVLLLGSSETVGRFHHLFAPIEPKLRLHRRLDNANHGPEFPAKSRPRPPVETKEPHVSPPSVRTQAADNLQNAVDSVLLQLYSPAAVVVNSGGDIVYISGHTGKYLEPAVGKANLNFHAMAREGLRASLGAALKQVGSQSEPLQLRGLQVQLPGGAQIVDVTVQTLHEPAVLQGMTLVVFRDVAPASVGRRGRKAPPVLEASHEAELQRLQEEIHAAREESRAAKEELQAANEELQSTNEELQSTNEELTTSKEEMQSMNEELQTINNELQTKLDDLALAQSDMDNLLNSTEIAILFLDQDLNVRRFTDRVTKIVNVREIDVGRPLSDLSTSLQYPELHDDALETLRTLAFSEKQVATTDGRWFEVRIMPYRRLDNMIDGVVITLVDITATKKLESALVQNSRP